MMQSCSAMRCASLGWRAGPRRVCEVSRRGDRHAMCLQERLSSPWSRMRAAGSPNSSYTAPRCFHTSIPRSTAQPSVHVDLHGPLPEQFRSLMRLLAHPVVVLTAHDGAHPRAMTMSSFTSLALTPTPLVSFNVATPSRTLNALKHGLDFNVHILSADRSGATVADKFTRGNADNVFDGVGYHLDRASAPVLDGDGVLYVLRCRLATNDAPSGGLMRVRDHTIVVGEVLEMIPGAGQKGFGLAYADRYYRRVGDSIKKH